ncbi:MAG: hypothetical protein ACYC91_14760 [Solirubrobacteraceae bacterium]
MGARIHTRDVLDAMLRLRRRALVFTAAVLLASPSAAAAFTTLIRVPRAYPRAPGEPYLQDAVMAGRDLVSVVSTDTRSTLAFVTPTGSIRSAALPGKPSSVTLLGSPSRLVAIESFGLGSARLLAGPAAGPLAVLDRCASAADASTRALDGNTVAYYRAGCSGSQPALVVRDLSSASAPAPAVLGLPARSIPEHVHLAGDFVAYELVGGAPDPRIVLQNWRTRAINYDQPAEPTRGCSDINAFGPPGRPQPAFCDLAVDRGGSLWELTDNLALTYINTTDNPRYGVPALLDTCTGALARLRLGSAAPPMPLARRACQGPLLSAGGSALLPTQSGESIVSSSGEVRSVGHPGTVYGFTGATMIVEHATCLGQSVVSLAAESDAPIAADAKIADEDPANCPAQPSAPQIILGPHPHLRVRIKCPIGCVGPLVIGVPASDGTYRPQASSRDFAIGARGALWIAIPLPVASQLVRDARMRAAHMRRARIHVSFWHLTIVDDPRRPFDSVNPFQADQNLLTPISGR